MIQWRNYRVASRQNATGPQPEGAPGQRRIPTPNIYYYTFSKKNSFVFPSDEFATGLERYSYATAKSSHTKTTTYTLLKFEIPMNDIKI